MLRLPLNRTFYRIASVSALAILIVSCGDDSLQGDRDAYKSLPVQTVDSVFAVQTRNGRIVMRVEAPLMERYDSDTTTLELFPQGLSVFGYNEDGLLESLIVSDEARHVTYKTKKKDDVWKATGNVVIHNVLEQQTMQTDTIFWDQTAHEIHTDCYVRMYSADGFMQGYGMKSDDRGRNAILNRPFNSFGITARDSTRVVIDSVNFIGPFPKKITNFAAPMDYNK